MKMIETLSTQEKNKMLIQREVVGIFSEMFKPEDPFYSLAYPICVGYYTTHSANKPVAPIYQIILDFIKEKGDIQEDQYLILTNTTLGLDIIRPMFIDKWTRTYNLLLRNDYDPLNSYKIKDTITYDTTINTGTKETTESDNDINVDTYGFNSETPVGADSTSNRVSETVTGDINDNKQIKTGTETTDHEGYDRTPANLIKAELNMRATNIFIDIVYKDIDTVATLLIYD